MFEQLQQVLDQFDAAIDLGNVGRQLHVGATAELDDVADEVVEAVAVLNGFNRERCRQLGAAGGLKRGDMNDGVHRAASLAAGPNE